MLLYHALMNTKQCNTCESTKPLTSFGKLSSAKDGLNRRCKDCDREYRRGWVSRNKEHTKEYQKNYRLENQERNARHQREWLARNRDKRRAYMREYRKNEMKDPEKRILHNLRRRVNGAVLLKCRSAGTTTLLGAPIKVVRERIESLWESGMSWDNYGIDGWHIDHIMPCASFDLSCPEQQRACFNYKNLQPLWARDNASKGAKIEHKKNNKPFLITIKADDLKEFVDEVEQGSMAVGLEDYLQEASAANMHLGPPDGYEIQQKEKYGDE